MLVKIDHKSPEDTKEFNEPFILNLDNVTTLRPETQEKGPSVKIRFTNDRHLTVHHCTLEQFIGYLPRGDVWQARKDTAPTKEHLTGRLTVREENGGVIGFFLSGQLLEDVLERYDGQYIALSVRSESKDIFGMEDVKQFKGHGLYHGGYIVGEMVLLNYLTQFQNTNVSMTIEVIDQ